MLLSALPWLIAAVVALLAGIGDLVLAVRLTPSRCREARLVLAALVLAALAAGVTWRGLTSGGISAPEALALLAAGALAGLLVLSVPRASPAPASAVGISFLGVAGLSGAAALLAAGQRAVPSATGMTLVWLWLSAILGGAGLGVWLPAAVVSLLHALRSPSAPLTVDRAVSDFPQRGRPVDPGRLPAAIGYPLLTGALLLAAMWDLRVYALAWRTPSFDLWMLAAWVLGGAYLHATSSWRPLELPPWFGSLIAVATLGAALLSALSAGLRLVG